MAHNLHSKLSSLADSFASAVLDTIRSTSLEELLTGGNHRSTGGGNSPPVAKAKREKSTGRLKRRSTQDIAKALGEVAALLKGHKQGLRAEQIRTHLQMLPKEMPRVLAEGLTKRKLKKKGQKRATTYYAA